MRASRWQAWRAAPSLAAPSLAALSLAALTCTRESGAAEVDAPPALPSVVWAAPRECPDGAAVDARLREVLDGDLLAFGKNWQIRGRVSGDGSKPWQLVLELREPNSEPRQRVLRAPHCDDLAEAAAVAIAIALGDAMQPDAAGRAGDTAPTADDRLAARSAAPESSARDEARAPEHPGLRLDTDRSPRRIDVSLGAVLDSASVSGWAPGGSLDVRAWLGDLGVGVYGLWLPAHERVIAPRQGASFSLLAGGARGCYALLGGAEAFHVAACAGIELGRFDADSYGLIASSRLADTWLAPGLGVELQGRVLGPLVLSSRIDVLWPLRRQEYRVDFERPVHDIPALSLRWTVGVGSGLTVR